MIRTGIKAGEGFMLKLVGGDEVRSCPTCKGKGTVPVPTTQAVRSGMAGFNQQGGMILVPGAGAKMPCPECKGKRVVMA